ncbi:MULTISPECIES: peptidoglycan-binding domain-containing protein [unclassified Streptomyces]|uniref:peptidoglycan-binding domain-containing protein n=1 Tax=unclassified Streptomyces TaxID=2593676 RepID=UPI0022B5F294|nr:MULTISPECIES: peptidoglycan-binding domain-containing protein [unclassified Streptomyces]MCZ7414003.1 peptidoglycan-binding domain-containing protein [Streptomyces sp. WMMC897]MCZ7430998.1 peptidoglycan-binding domain-containing protein [Streptomyces sp. WMMC1477]
MSLRRKAASAAVVIAIGGAAALASSPAVASNSYNGNAYIKGGGWFGDDWGDEGVLTTSTNANSNATCLWQKVLWADGFLPWSGIDGVFGKNTRAATVAWQQYHGLPDDGAVGKDTFGMADGGLLDTNGNGAVDTFGGYAGSFNVWRDSQGRYAFYDGSGNARRAGYDYRTCS